MKSFNPTTVHDAAANLFWRFAEKVGVSAANESVIKTRGSCLFSQPFTQNVLQEYGVLEQPQTVLKDFSDVVAAEALRYASDDENMNGIIYGEDAQSGRSPSATSIETTPLKLIPQKVAVGLSLVKRQPAHQLKLRADYACAIHSQPSCFRNLSLMQRLSK